MNKKLIKKNSYFHGCPTSGYHYYFYYYDYYLINHSKVKLENIAISWRNWLQRRRFRRTILCCCLLLVAAKSKLRTYIHIYLHTYVLFLEQLKHVCCCMVYCTYLWYLHIYLIGSYKTHQRLLV